MKSVYCSKCNTQLPITRKAMKKFGIIIDFINPHICPEVPLELDFPLMTLPTFTREKSDQKLNKLRPSIGTDTLGDRRSAEHIKPVDSTAPFTLLQQMRDLHNTIPANDPGKEPNDG